MVMPHPRRLCLLVALVLALGVVRAAPAQDKFYRPELTTKFIDGALRTDWYGVYHTDHKDAKKDQKIGYVRSERKRVGATIVEEQVMLLKLVSMDQKSEF